MVSCIAANIRWREEWDEERSIDTISSQYHSVFASHVVTHGSVKGSCQYRWKRHEETECRVAFIWFIWLKTADRPASENRVKGNYLQSTSLRHSLKIIWCCWRHEGLYLKPLSTIVNSFSTQRMTNLPSSAMPTSLSRPKQQQLFPMARGCDALKRLREARLLRLLQDARNAIEWIWRHSIWVNMDGCGCQDQRHDGMMRCVIHKATRSSRVSKKPTHQKHILKNLSTTMDQKNKID